MGDPDLKLFLEQHSTYVSALEAAGLEVTNLPADEEYPDSVFVEDPALCLREIAILMRPGASSRQGEVARIEPHVRSIYEDNVYKLPDGAFAEGGDILVTDREIVVGLSTRTNMEGAAAIAEIAEPRGYSVRHVQTPVGVLHLKTDCATLGDERILSTRRLAASGIFDGYDVLLVPDGEEAAANAIRVNDSVLVAGGFEQTRQALAGTGLTVVPVSVTEAAKLDGGLSCMSLRLP